MHEPTFPPGGGIPPHPSIASASPWMTTREAAAYIRMSYRTLEDLRMSGGGPVYARPGRNMVRYHRDDLDAWMAARKFRFTSQEVGTAISR